MPTASTSPDLYSATN
uniref:Uncharacterized protein n=1 Tax=Arundo donax TaxID=35708 RepID=A0A0A8ZKX1_ARUDO